MLHALEIIRKSYVNVEIGIYIIQFFPFWLPFDLC